MNIAQQKNALVPFAFGDNMVRVRMDENGNPWWVAKDVCRVLGLENNREAISNLDDDEKADVRITDTSSNGVEQRRTVNIISESGLYALVFRSRKPEAKAFSKWVRTDVLPALRKTGRYEVPGQPVSYRTAMPEELPPEALNLRPSTRQRLWQDALQTARLDGNGSAAAREWFVFLCRMMTAERPRNDVQQRILDFMDECLGQAKGYNTPSTRIYKAFVAWWTLHARNHRERLNVPGIKTVSVILAERFGRFKSSRIVFKDCRLIPDQERGGAM